MQPAASSSKAVDNPIKSLTAEQLSQLKGILLNTNEELMLEDSINLSKNQDELNKLRSLLFPAEEIQQRLFQNDFRKFQRLIEWLEANQLKANQLTQILPKAMEDLASNSPRFTEALAPQIEKSLHRSVAKNPQPLIDSLFPIIGPMIRKSISESLSDMLKNINQLVDQSFSIKALKWRWEARKTGKSYAEIALIRSLSYQVDQIFLIHQETSILLEHLTSSNSIHKDADMVSGMLSAVQDFATDAFSIEDGGYLSELKLGDFTLILEKGPKASIVAAVLGKAPASLRTELQQKLESIHHDFNDELINFNGNTQVFDSAIADLSTCLISQKRSQRKPILRWVLLSLIILSGMFYSGQLMWKHFYYDQAWSELVSQLKQQPGIIVLENKDSKIHGLVDPIIGDIKQFTARQPWFNSNKLDIEQIDFHFRPFISLDSSIIEKRIEQSLYLPKGVQHQFKDSVLSLKGETTSQWLTNNSIRLQSIQGVNHLDTSRLIFTDIEQRKNQEKWYKLLNQHQKQIESIHFYFDVGSTELTEQHKAILKKLVSHIYSVEEQAKNLQLHVEWSVVGFIDHTSGSIKLNTQLTQQRVDAITQQFKALTKDLNMKFSTALSLSEVQSEFVSKINLRRVSLKSKVSPVP